MTPNGHAFATNTQAGTAGGERAVEASPEIGHRQPFLTLVWLTAAITAATLAYAAWVLIADAWTPGAENPAGRLTHFLLSLVWCVVGLFIGFARPDRRVARLAFLAALTTGHVFLEVGVLHYGVLIAPLHVIIGFHFFCRFPSGPIPGGVWKYALGLLYAAVGIVLTIRFTLRSIALAYGAGAAARYAGLAEFHQTFGVWVFVGGVIGMLAVIPFKYRGLTDEDQRRRIRWVAYGSSIGLAPNLWYSVVALQGPVGPVLALVTNTSSVVIPICVAYVVVKHRVLDISVVVRRGLQYLLARRVLQLAVALPIFVLTSTLVRHRDLTIDQFVRDARGYLFWLGAAGLALRFRGPIQRWLDRRFFRDESDREQLLLGMMDEVGKVDSISELSRLVSDRLASALHPTIAYIWYRDRAELASASSSDPLLTPADLPSAGRWLAWVEKRGVAARFPLPADAGMSRDEARWFGDHGIRLIVPITDSADCLVGALLLGEKKSDEPYTARDEQLLGAIAKQAAVVRENLRLRARVSDEVRVRHDVLARLDGRLPDLLKECPACGACFDGDVDHCAHDGAMLTLSLPVSRTIDDKYRLDRLIGKGGMGAVYEARDLRLDRSVAVKVLLGRAFGHQPALRRFRREARAAAHLNHPNIVAVYDVGSLEGEGAYLVMERVHGATLRAAFDRTHPLAPPVAAEWFDQILAGIAAAHTHGIVHRDLKPDNVMGRRNDAGVLSVKILDLGLVKFRDEAPASGTMTAKGLVMGTLGYMSPEQLLGNPVDHRTDLFAIAVMLIEALTGERPFRGDTYAEFWRALQLTTPRLPGSSREVRALDELLQRCLAAAPADRFASAAALRRELIPLLRGCPNLPA